MNALKAVWAWWKRVAHRIGVIQTFIIMTLFYFLVIGPSSIIAFILRRDLLKARKTEPSYYRSHPDEENSLDRYKHQF